MNRKTMISTVTLIELTLATLAGASSIRYDQAANADFATYTTIRWASAPAKGPEAISDRRIREALAAELAAKGYRLVDSGDADLALDYFAVVRRRTAIDETGGPRFGRNLRVRTEPEGTLVVAFVETRGGATVWHGAVSDAVASNPAKAEKRTARAVGKLLEKFPSKSAT